ncbi:Detected protein of unknown function [Hibiscus syriacus]|uniref:peroxidase n=1 Tax=Hibiscus syriacus TaxID=106335 RepID=A0A6A3AYD8_HIBSY|nr:Detected protein of unknown function [Hibiscus syriacus]
MTVSSRRDEQNFERIRRDRQYQAEVEKSCPETVSCIDILTVATRDATVLLGGPYWRVPYGRKDSKTSNETDAYTVPISREKLIDLLELFQSKGLNIVDLRKCRCGGDEYVDIDATTPTTFDSVDLDATTPTTFDSQFYANLEREMGLLSTDQRLYSDSRT